MKPEQNHVSKRGRYLTYSILLIILFIFLVLMITISTTFQSSRRLSTITPSKNEVTVAATCNGCTSSSQCLTGLTGWKCLTPCGMDSPLVGSCRGLTRGCFEEIEHGKVVSRIWVD